MATIPYNIGSRFATGNSFTVRTFFTWLSKLGGNWKVHEA